MLGVLGEDAVILGREKPLLDAQFAQRDLEHLEVGDLIDHRLDGSRVIVIVIVAVVGHRRNVPFDQA